MNTVIQCASSAEPGAGYSHQKTVKRGNRHLVVDIHCHLGVPAADALMRPHMKPGMLTINSFSSPASDEVNRAQFAAIGPKMSNLEVRLKDMDAQGIDVQVLSPSPGQYFYWADPEIALEGCKLTNQGIAEACQKYPKRFVGLGNVPLQSPELAVRELRRCVKELGLKGVELSTNINGRELADPEFLPFFAAAEELGVLIFLHPLGFTHGQRLSEHYFNNLIGNPLESTIAVGHLIFGGVLDRYPGLKICVAHGGGYLATYWGRMDHGFRARADCRQHISREPSSYLKQLYFDTLVFDPAHLAFLVRTYGADHLMLGTDYPFDMSEPDPVGFHAHLSEEDRAKIVGGTALSVLGLDARAFQS